MKITIKKTAPKFTAFQLTLEVASEEDRELLVHVFHNCTCELTRSHERKMLQLGHQVMAKLERE